ncbi:MAG: hypothetical protein JOZ43_06115, partial [Acidobacteriales bacterium]|nr:hypothetical protein [Terriglobales bacterium]
IPADFTQDGSFHTIEIDVTDKKYKARSRRGYFAQSNEVAASSSGK